MAIPGRSPSTTKTHAWSAKGKKNKNQADAAAGELPARAGPGKRCGARSWVGGPTAPPRRGGVGEGNPPEGCPSSASSAKVQSPAGGRTELAGTTRSCRKSLAEEAAPGRQVAGEGKDGALPMTHVQPGSAQPSARLLLRFPCLQAASLVREAVVVRCPAGSLEQERLKPKLSPQSWGTSSFLGTSRTQHSQETPELRPALAGELPARAGDTQSLPRCLAGRKAPARTPFAVLPAESEELPRTKAEQHRDLAPTPVATGRNRCSLSQRGAIAGRAASMRSVRAAKLSNEAGTPEA